MKRFLAALAAVAVLAGGAADTPLTELPYTPGLDPAAMDRSADPCTDFYQFACGGWIQANPIPADHASWGRGNELDERNKAAIKSLLDEAARGADAGARKLGEFYASCMDEAAVERAGTAPLRALLAKTQ